MICCLKRSNRREPRRETERKCWLYLWNVTNESICNVISPVQAQSQSQQVCGYQWQPTVAAHLQSHFATHLHLSPSGCSVLFFCLPSSSLIFVPPLHRCNSQTSFDYSSPDLNIFPITVCLRMYENVANIFLFQSKFAAMVTKYAISHRGWIWNPNRWRNPQGRCQSQPCSDQAQDGRVQQEPAVGTLLQVKPNLIFTSPFRRDVENEGLDISDLEILAGNAESSQHHENSQAALHHRIPSAK